MIAEIHGAGFQNKGAELMLRTTLAELKKRLPGFIPAIDPWYGTFQQRNKLDLYQIWPSRHHVGTKGYSKRLFKQKVFASLYKERIFKSLVETDAFNYGMVNMSKVGALIDIAGFAYTDEWGPQPTIDMALLTAFYKKSKKPVILMPQAFGPFYNEETKAAFKTIIDSASLIFARDSQSYDTICGLSSNHSHIHKAPDITLFYPGGYAGATDETESKYVCIIPNVRMLDQGKEAWGDTYKDYLLSLCKEVLKSNKEIYFVVQDTSGDDLMLISELHAQLASPNSHIIEEEDVFLLKKIIAGSYFVIGSRFHGLVAAFSAQVPSIALGWSHKYDMLFADFGLEKFVIAAGTPFQEVMNLTNELLDYRKNMAYRSQIAQKLTGMQAVNSNMWDMISSLLLK